jgi:hypothetical protein
MLLPRRISPATSPQKHSLREIAVRRTDEVRPKGRRFHTSACEVVGWMRRKTLNE